MKPSNLIPQRVAEFLRIHPPFNLLSPEALFATAQEVEIRYALPGEVLFAEGQAPLSHFFVIRQGQVRIFHPSTQELVDRCDQGELFGARPLIANEPYLASAVVDEETLLYAIPVKTGKKWMETHPQVALFFTLGYASGKPMQRITTQRQLGHAPNTLLDQTVIARPSNLVTINPNDTIADAALLMNKHRIGSLVVVNQYHQPVGLMTDTDFRKKIGTGEVLPLEQVSKLMSTPVVCIQEGATAEECLLHMMGHGIHHLVVTKDGGPQTAAIGLVSNHDLMMATGNSPARILKELNRATDAQALMQAMERIKNLKIRLLEGHSNIQGLTKTLSALYRSTVERALDLELHRLEQPPVPFAWLTMGSLARQEMIHLTDQDHALVFQSDAPEVHRPYFLKLATGVAQTLESLGWIADPYGLGAHRPEWCLSLEEWKTKSGRWMQTPDPENILLSTIFLDFHSMGKNPQVGHQLREFIDQNASNHALFLSTLALDALKTPPPLTFFRQFMVEKSGDHADSFDLKRRALLPLMDAARVMALELGVGSTLPTHERLRQISMRDEPNAPVWEEAADHMTFLLELRGEQGLKNGDSGRYILPQNLSGFQRQKLKRAFSTITEVQQILKTRFRTAYLG